MALTLDRKAFIDILAEGQGDIGGGDAAAARRRLGHAAGDAAERCPATIPMSRRTATKPRQIMEKLGYGPDKRLAVKVSTRNLPIYRDPAVDPDRPAKEI